MWLATFLRGDAPGYGDYGRWPIGLAVFFAKGDVQRSLGQRPRYACGSLHFPWAIPLAMMSMAVGQLDWPSFSPKAMSNVALGNALGMRVARDISQGRCPWL